MGHAAGDFRALRSFNTKEHLYLSVEGTGKDAHLEVKEIGFFGRIWMFLGISHASMKKVIAYAANQLQSNPKFPQLYPTLKAKLADKIVTKYAVKHNYNLPEVLYNYLKITPVAKPATKVTEVASPKSIFDVTIPKESPLNKSIFETLTFQQKAILGWEEPLPNQPDKKRKDEYANVLGFTYTQNWKNDLKELLRQHIQGDWNSPQAKYDYEQEADALIEAIEERLELLQDAGVHLKDRERNWSFNLRDLCQPIGETGVKAVLATKEETEDLTLDQLATLNGNEAVMFDRFYWGRYDEYNDLKLFKELKNVPLQKILSYPDEAYQRWRGLMFAMARIHERESDPKVYKFVKELRAFSSKEDFMNTFCPPGTSPPKEAFALTLFERFK